MLNLISGKKAYTLGIAGIVYGVAGLVLGSHDANEAMKLVGEGFGVIFLRQGIAKVG